MVTKGFKCLGSIPDPSDEKGYLINGTRFYRKLFVIEYDEDREAELLAAEDDYLNGKDQVSAIEFYRAQKGIKRYINDFEEK